jgi:hypothetical protein
MCCTVSVSILQNMQDGSPLNRPIVCRYLLTGPCPVRIATAILGRLFATLISVKRNEISFLRNR